MKLLYVLPMSRKMFVVRLNTRKTAIIIVDTNGKPSIKINNEL